MSVNWNPAIAGYRIGGLPNILADQSYAPFKPCTDRFGGPLLCGAFISIAPVFADKGIEDIPLSHMAA